MANTSVRLPDDWKRFDRTALAGAIVLPLLLGLLWLSGFGPWDQQACAVATKPLALDLSRDEGLILLTGAVATEAEKTAIRQAAEKIYGKAAVTDRVAVDPSIMPMSWAANAPDLLDKLKALREPAKASIRGSELTLSGTVASPGDKKSRAEGMAALLGKEAVLKNELVVKAAEPPKPAPPPAPAAAPAPAPGSLAKRKLPDGTEISIIAGGVESQVIAFIEDPARAIDKNVWFDFDRLQFETGSSKLTERSRDQIETMAAILKAYPNVAIKVGGYTDNVGDPDMNLKLSAARAERAMQELVALGIGADRLEAEGYGEQHPIAPNDNAEGRAKNRRTAVSVRRK